LFVISLLGMVVLAGFGAVFATMTGTPEEAITAEPAAPEAAQSAVPQDAARERSQDETRAESDGARLDEPREWEGQLARARQAMADGSHDEAYAIANQLPEDSILRQTPEFAEIRYRYAQAHVDVGERALEEGDLEQARAQAMRVLAIEGITPKQRRDGKRLLRRAGEP
jgi:hypothetical protein